VAAAESCGQSGLWFNDVGICAAKVAGEFFGLDDASDPPPDPGAADAGEDSPPRPAGGGDAGPGDIDDPRRPGGFQGCGCRAGGGASTSTFGLVVACVLVLGRRRRWTR